MLAVIRIYNVFSQYKTDLRLKPPPTALDGINSTPLLAHKLNIGNIFSVKIGQTLALSLTISDLTIGAALVGKIDQNYP